MFLPFICLALPPDSPFWTAKGELLGGALQSACVKTQIKFAFTLSLSVFCQSTSWDTTQQS
jgi:hypothetical protein